MFSNLLSGKLEHLYCINCGIDDFVLTTEQGKQFHVYYQSFSSKAKPVECHGPFVYSKPPSNNEFIAMSWANIDDEIAHDFQCPLFGREEKDFEETDIDQLSQLQQSDLHYQSLQEILIDNILHGDDPYLQ